MAIPLFVINIYYNMIIAWTLYYIGNSFINPLPWTVCDNDWNSLHCVKNSGLLNNHTQLLSKMSNQTTLNETSSWITAQEDFWQYVYLINMVFILFCLYYSTLYSFLKKYGNLIHIRQLFVHSKLNNVAKCVLERRQKKRI